ncbi:MAG: hypothetical protein K2N11_07390 [Mucispirillum sp.]|nr:hypothetical protein [Mucispirillum sp.]
MNNHKYNFPEDLLYENIAKEMNGKENFISNRGSVFPHASINNVDFNAQLPEQNTSDDDLQKYLAKLPKTFDEWTK